MIVFDFLISNSPYFFGYFALCAIIVPSIEAVFDPKIKIPSFISLPFFLSFLGALICFFLSLFLGFLLLIMPSMNILVYNSSDEVRQLQVNGTSYSIKPKEYRTIAYPKSSAAIKGTNVDNTKVFFETQINGEGAYVANVGSEKILEVEELPYEDVRTHQSLYENFGTRHLVNDIVLVDKTEKCTYHYDSAPSSLRSKYNSRHFVLKPH